MLLLPIRQRTVEPPAPQVPPTTQATTEERLQREIAEVLAGRQALLEALAWSPQTRSSDGEDSTLQLTVKNTFIEVSTPETVDLHKLGAQTCKARLDGPEPTFNIVPEDEPVRISSTRSWDDVFRRSPKPQSLDHVEVEPDASPSAAAGVPQYISVSTPLASPGVVEGGFGGLSRYSKSDTPPGMPPGITPASMLAPPSVAQCSGTSPQHVPAPPPYLPPFTFQEMQTLPPPIAPPGTIGRQVLLEAFGCSLDVPDRSAKSTHSEDRKVIVKNTFIDLEDEQTPVVRGRSSQTCTARFSNPNARDLFPPTPTGERQRMHSGPGAFSADKSGTPKGGSPRKKVQSPVAAGMLPTSMGSKDHGKIGPDEQPMCQPCAWFYKDSGCLNSASCRYCHLCPQGELKNRKKQKIARLRKEDAAAAATGGTSPTGSGSSPTLFSTTPSSMMPAHVVITPMQAVTLRQPGPVPPSHAQVPLPLGAVVSRSPMIIPAFVPGTTTTL